MFRLSSLTPAVILTTLLSTEGVAAAPETSAEPKQIADYGTVIYSLYVDEPLTTLSVMARAKSQGLTQSQLDSLLLMEGGAALGFGMPRLAQNNLQPANSHPATVPQALYWLSRLNFAQNRSQAALTAYDAFVVAAKQADQQIEEIISPAQWYEINYQAALAFAELTGDETSVYESALPEKHITRQYLAYNRAIRLFNQGEAEQALREFKQIELVLTEQAEQATNTSSLFSWIDSGLALQDPSVSPNEIYGLLNQTYLSHGQVLLAEGRFTDALTLFGRVSGQSIVRDEALLQYGWGLARGDNWPMAMGVWQYLAAALPTNLYTLQARHALAIGYAQQGGEVQAYEHLSQLNSQLESVIASLDALTERLQTPGFWGALADTVDNVAEKSQQNQRSSDWTMLWPAEHQDLLVNLLFSDNAQQDKLSQLTELNSLNQQLAQQREQLNVYSQLLNERDDAHARRALAHADNPTAKQLSLLKEQLVLAESRQDKARQLIAESRDEALYFKGVATYADSSELAWITRLERAEKRLARLSAERKMRPAYAERIKRLKGILTWQLAEQSMARQWQVQQGIVQAKAALAQAGERQTEFASLLGANNVTAPQRKRIQQLVQHAEQHLSTSQRLIKSLQQQLSQEALNSIAERRDYLTQQQSRSTLAMLQLQDRWRTGSADGEAGQQTTKPKEQEND